MWKKLLVLVIVALAGATVAGAQNKEAAKVTKAVTQFTQGMEKGDLKLIESVWAQDDEITVFEGGSMDTGWANYRDKHLVPEMKAYKNLTYELREMKVKVNGNMALVRSRYYLSGEANEKKVESRGLITAVLEKRQGKWLLVHWHLSASRRQ